MKMMKRKLGSARGITIIEMMITAVIIGLVAAAAVPRMQIAYERMKFKKANKSVNSTLRLARSMAITDKEQYGVFFDGDSKQVVLFKDVVSPGAYMYEAGDSICRIDTLPAEFTTIVTDVANNNFFFERNGSCHFVGSGNIYTFAYTEDVMNFTTHNILAATGRVHSTTYDPYSEGGTVN